ncbi:MAG: Crp/Fnr family transcriptional regulator, partial [Janthinobacterium lividum]
MDPEVLTKAPLFAELDGGSAEALEQAMGTLRLSKGEILFREGETEDRLYVVVAGKIKLGRSGSAGRENLLAVLGPGQMFGELSVFDPGPRSTTATAVTAVEVRTLEHDELMRWIEGHPEVARSLLGQLAARLRRANDVVADLVFSDVPGRVAKQLL